MGVSLSWVAARGITKEELLTRTALRDTGEPADIYEVPFAGAALPNGWFVIVADDLDYVWPERVAELSSGCRMLGFQVHEGVMVSYSFCYENGEQIWEMSCKGDRKAEDLYVGGTPPDGFAALRDRFVKKQAESGDRDMVNYIFEIPVETALAECGYRYDDTQFDWGEASFTRLEPA